MRGRSMVCVLGLLAGAASSAGAGLAPAAEEEEQALWSAARDAISVEPVWRYLDRFPKGRHTDSARTRLAKLGAAPGRRFDGHWAGALRCASGFEWLNLSLAAQIDDGAVHADRGTGQTAWLDLSGRIGPDGTLELEGKAGPVAGPLGNSGPHAVYLEAVLAAGDLDARGALGPLLCVMELTRGE